MTTLLSLLPLLLVLGLLASGRASALVAGLAGLAATLAASATLVLQADGPAAVALLFRREVPAGLWLSWHVIAIVVTGVFFHRATLARAGTGGGGGGGTGAGGGTGVGSGAGSTGPTTTVFVTTALTSPFSITRIRTCFSPGVVYVCRIVPPRPSNTPSGSASKSHWTAAPR